MTPLVSTTLLGGCLRSTKQKIALRVDASSQIGTGHFMRCLAVADALQQRGDHVRFVCRHLPDYLRNELNEKGYEFRLLNSELNDSLTDELAHSGWLGVNQSQDAADSIRVLSDQVWDWLIVDHYALDACWESMLRQVSTKILVIDDIADRQHDCDILLDQNMYADMESRYVGKVPEQCQLLLGPCYALLRDEFSRLHGKTHPHSGAVNRLLVFFGGMDTANYTGLTIEVLAQMDVSHIHVDVVIGAQHPFRQKIRQLCSQFGFMCHVQTDEMAELMMAADLAIGAGGSACWERCCLGLPAILVALADNQINIATSLGLFGACVYVGTLESATASRMHRAVADLLNESNTLISMSKLSYSLVDGLGVNRVCQKIGY
jgi:UDP-2,4-diacetamido-2,4,6-trideoxy-beta-L-altropyranose hydrolase